MREQGNAFLGVKSKGYQLFAGKDFLSNITSQVEGFPILKNKTFFFFPLPLPFPFSFPPSQVALTSFRLNILNTARQTLTAPHPATLPQHQSLAWEGCG